MTRQIPWLRVFVEGVPSRIRACGRQEGSGMNRRVLPLIIGSLLFPLGCGGPTDPPAPLFLQAIELCSDYPESAIARFEDANLEAVIRGALGIGTQEDLTCGLVSGLTDLSTNCSYRGCSPPIESIVGIQNLTSLTSLNLSNTSLTDIRVLSGLTSLTSLRLDQNSITDISSLNGLTSLTSLRLDQNSITDISALSGAHEPDGPRSWGEQDHRHQRAGRAHEPDGTRPPQPPPLGGVGSDRSDHRHQRPERAHEPDGPRSRGNRITDISVLDGLTNLTDLDLRYNSMTDATLSGLTSLTELSLRLNSITDVTLSGLTSLTTLHLNENSITDTSALSGLTSLTELDLSENSITDISALDGLTSLTGLSLFNNPDLSNIQALLDNAGLGPYSGPTPDWVALRNTNVSCTDIAALKAKGVTVTSDCS